MSKKTRGEKFVEEMELKMPRFSIQDLWDFTLKEICKNLECSKAGFVLDNKRYIGFKRRFNYFVKMKNKSKMEIKK